MIVLCPCVQVGGRFLVDTSLEEETCSTSRLSLAVNKDGNIVSVTKDGTGGIPYGKMNDIISVSKISLLLCVCHTNHHV